MKCWQTGYSGDNQWVRQSPEERKDGTDDRFLGCLWSPKVEHYSDPEDDNVNWGHTSRISSAFQCNFLRRMICPQDQRRDWHKWVQFFFRDLLVKWENRDHFIKSYQYLDIICSIPPLPIIKSTSCQVASTMSLICCAPHSITPFSPRSWEQTGLNCGFTTSIIRKTIIQFHDNHGCNTV